MDYYRILSIVLCAFFGVAAVIGLTIHLTEFSKDLSNDCFNHNIGNPTKQACVGEPSWYDTEYKKWERGADVYIAQNILYWWIN